MKLAILGAGDHGKVVEILSNVVVDVLPISEGDWPVMGNTAPSMGHVVKHSSEAVRIGDSHIRYRKLYDLLSVELGW